MRKKITIAVFAFVVVLSFCLAGCGSNEKTFTQSEVDQIVQEALSEADAANTPTVTKAVTKAVTKTPSRTSSSRASSGYTNDELKATLYTYAEAKVKNHISSYQNVDFSSIGNCSFQKGEDGVYMMSGKVGTVTWGIMAEIVNNKWQLIMLNIGDDVYFD